MAPAADGTHPTGMHSCLSSVFRLSLHQCKNLKKTISLVQQNDLNRDLISIENSILAKLLTMHCNKYTVLPLLNLASMYFYSNEWHMPYYLQNHFAINTPTFTSCVHRNKISTFQFDIEKKIEEKVRFVSNLHQFQHLKCIAWS